MGEPTPTDNPITKKLLIKGAVFGALIGVISTANAWMALLTLFGQDRGYSAFYWLSLWWMGLLHMLIKFGPGALLLSALLTRLLHPMAPRFKTKWKFVARGMLLGLPLGVLNLLAAMSVIAAFSSGPPVGWIWLVLILPGLAGGAGIGLGCALAIPFTRRISEYLVLSCPCGKRLRFRNADRGKKATCPECGKSYLIPGNPNPDQ